MFGSSFVESAADTVNLDGLSSDTLARVLHFVYTDRIGEAADPSAAIEVGAKYGVSFRAVLGGSDPYPLQLLVAANMMQLPRLVTLCEREIVPHLSAENVVQVIQVCASQEMHLNSPSASPSFLQAAEVHGSHQLVMLCEFEIALNYKQLSLRDDFERILSPAARSRVLALHSKCETEKETELNGVY